MLAGDYDIEFAPRVRRHKWRAEHNHARGDRRRAAHRARTRARIAERLAAPREDDALPVVPVRCARCVRNTAEWSDECWHPCSRCLHPQRRGPRPPDRLTRFVGVCRPQAGTRRTPGGYWWPYHEPRRRTAVVQTVAPPMLEFLRLYVKHRWADVVGWPLYYTIPQGSTYAVTHFPRCPRPLPPTQSWAAHVRWALSWPPALRAWVRWFRRAQTQALLRLPLSPEPPTHR